MKNLYILYYCLTRPFFRLFYRIKPVGRDKITSGAALICANHSSNKDIMCLAYAVGIKHFLRFASKIELYRVPVLGRLLKQAGTIFIDRGNSDVAAVKNIMRALKNGQKVVIFPEGTRVADDGSSQAKTGAVMIASRTAVPIIPVHIPRKKKLFGTITVTIGEPYIPERTKGGSSQYEAQANELMGKIADLGRDAG